MQACCGKYYPETYTLEGKCLQCARLHRRYGAWSGRCRFLKKKRLLQEKLRTICPKRPITLNKEKKVNTLSFLIKDIKGQRGQEKDKRGQRYE